MLMKFMSSSESELGFSVSGQTTALNGIMRALDFGLEEFGFRMPPRV